MTIPMLKNEIELLMSHAKLFGKDFSGFLKLLEEMVGDEKEKALLSEHPEIQERIEKLFEKIRKIRPEYPAR
ncbi:MAG: hypothetical protein HY453_00420 [Parcubacteria group bacterium]|nr:hypothetical protein [Parcubacteria group bacterium]